MKKTLTNIYDYSLLLKECNVEIAATYFRRI